MVAWYVGTWCVPASQVSIPSLAQCVRRPDQAQRSCGVWKAGGMAQVKFVDLALGVSLFFSLT